MVHQGRESNLHTMVMETMQTRGDRPHHVRKGYKGSFVADRLNRQVEILLCPGVPVSAGVKHDVSTPTMGEVQYGLQGIVSSGVDRDVGSQLLCEPKVGVRVVHGDHSPGSSPLEPLHGNEALEVESGDHSLVAQLNVRLEYPEHPDRDWLSQGCHGRIHALRRKVEVVFPGLEIGSHGIVGAEQHHEVTRFEPAHPGAHFHHPAASLMARELEGWEVLGHIQAPIRPQVSVTYGSLVGLYQHFVLGQLQFSLRQLHSACTREAGCCHLHVSHFLSRTGCRHRNRGIQREIAGTYVRISSVIARGM